MCFGESSGLSATTRRCPGGRPVEAVCKSTGRKPRRAVVCRSLCCLVGLVPVSTTSVFSRDEARDLRRSRAARLCPARIQDADTCDRTHPRRQFARARATEGSAFGRRRRPPDCAQPADLARDRRDRHRQGGCHSEAGVATGTRATVVRDHGHPRRLRPLPGTDDSTDPGRPSHTLPRGVPTPLAAMLAMRAWSRAGELRRP